ncbi:hypothetical protein HZB90_00770 [archaeon]|nr:hypothetical protein [archaeon]
MGLEDKVTRQHAGLTEEQKARILNEVERERRSVMVCAFLERLVTYDDQLVRVLGAINLRNLPVYAGSNAVSFFRNSLNSKYPEVREETIMAFESLLPDMPKEAIELYRLALGLDWWHCKNEIEFAASRLGVLPKSVGRAALPLYELALTYENENIREQAVGAIAQLAEILQNEAAKLFEKAIFDSSEKVQLSGIEVVARIAEKIPEYAPNLFEKAMTHSNSSIRGAATDLLFALEAVRPAEAEQLYKRYVKHGWLRPIVKMIVKALEGKYDPFTIEITDVPGETDPKKKSVMTFKWGPKTGRRIKRKNEWGPKPPMTNIDVRVGKITLTKGGEKAQRVQGIIKRIGYELFGSELEVFTFSPEGSLSEVMQRIVSGPLGRVGEEAQHFFRGLIESRYLSNEEDLTKLKLLCQNIYTDYRRLRLILQADKAKDLTEMVECCGLDICCKTDDT